MVEQNQNIPPVETPYDPQAARQAALEEGGGVSPYLARNRTHDPDPGPVPPVDPLEAETRPPEDWPPQPATPKPRASRRGGRSYPEKSGRDVAREIDNETRETDVAEGAGKAAIAEYRRKQAAEEAARLLEEHGNTVGSAIVFSRQSRRERGLTPTSEFLRRPSRRSSRP
jgi:hypothetical protein